MPLLSYRHAQLLRCLKFKVNPPTAEKIFRSADTCVSLLLQSQCLAQHCSLQSRPSRGMMEKQTGCLPKAPKFGKSEQCLSVLFSQLQLSLLCSRLPQDFTL